MLLSEILGETDKRAVRIFATDLSEAAIRKARAGEYSSEDVKGISAKRLERFFVFTEGRYRIVQSVRDMCVFAPHDVLSNPPFSRMDFISCCNLLIYLEPAAQKKVFSTLHYALREGGLLMLGKSETARSSRLFSLFDEQHNLYLRKDGLRTLPVLNSRQVTQNKAALTATRQEAADPQATESTVRDILFARYIPACAVITQHMEIIRFMGATSDFLVHPTGKATLNILSMARPEIAFELRDAIHKAVGTGRESSKKDIEIMFDSVLHKATLDVLPLQGTGSGMLFLVVFSRGAQVLKETVSSPAGSRLKESERIRKLNEKLALLRNELISVSEENEKTNRILQAAHEETLSSNEEFQSMNEELESSKEEIESANEELLTSNQELQIRNEQLAEAFSFSEAIINTLHEPMLVLDKDLRIKSANKAFYRKFKVAADRTDGELFFETSKSQWEIPRLRELLEHVIRTESGYIEDHEITHDFALIGRRTFLVNARRIIQKIHHEHLILLAFTDISERVIRRKQEKEELEGIISERTRELEEKNTTLERMNKELETFSFISSHDLQEPLRKIRNFATCLLTEESHNLTGQGKDYLERMQETVKRMQMLIEAMLSYSRLKEEDRKRELTSIRAIILEVAGSMKEALLLQKATISITGDANAGVIRFQFLQMISNLLGNALKFAKQGRRLHVKVNIRTGTGKKLKTEGLLPATRYCHIAIADNGIGFDPQYNDRVFGIFQRLNEYEDFKGTGIGLAICRRIAENHDGFITAKGVSGKGARFDIYFPA